MPSLVFIDGRIEPVSYNKAVLIDQVKHGATEIDGKPVTDRQRAFAASVSEVMFESLRKTVRSEGRRPSYDLELHKILGNPKLKGKKKFDAVRKYISDRK